MQDVRKELRLAPAFEWDIGKSIIDFSIMKKKFCLLIALIGSMAAAAQYKIKLTRAHLDSAETLHLSFEVSNEWDAPVYVNESDLFYEVLVFSYDNEIIRPDVKINKFRRSGIDKHIIEKKRKPENRHYRT